MVRNRCYCNILKFLKENCDIFIFYLPINFKLLWDAISGIAFYIHMLPVNFDCRICSYNEICFDLMFLSKFNQVILVAILLFLDLRSVLQVIFFVSFYFPNFFFFLVLGGCYFQTSKIIAKSIGIIWQK